VELHQIKYFLALCETLNFARAAERCGVSQPSLSRAIQKMEHELGGALIRRERRLTHLTELGCLVRPMLQEVMTHADRTKTAARHFLSDDAKPLRLGILSSIGARRLAGFLARFGAAHPDFAFSVTDGDSEALKERLLSGNLDAAIMSLSGREGDRLRGQRLYREPAVVLFPGGHRFARLATVPLRELEGEPFLWRAGCELHGHVRARCREEGFELRVACQSAREDWIQAMAAAGHGVTVVLADANLGLGSLALPLIDPEFARDIDLVTVVGRPFDAAIQRALRALRGHRWDPDSAPRTPVASLPLERLRMVAEIIR
jgi:DNA-binding transcriptional LysR family regulator